MTRVFCVIMSMFFFICDAKAEAICDFLNGSIIVAQDDENTYLGKITRSVDADSIFNDYGTYGNRFSSQSIWNRFSTFGNQFNGDSPFNKFSASPPMLIKGGEVIGYLSVNRSIEASISPNLLKAMCEDQF